MFTRFILLLLLTLVMSGCHECSWISSKPLTYPPDLIWATSYQAISQRYDILKASRKDKKIETDWLNRMTNSYLDSYRMKAFLKIEKYQRVDQSKDLSIPLNLQEKVTDKDEYEIKICVKREQNRDIDNPGMAAGAQWVIAGDDVGEAHLILNLIMARLSLKNPNLINSDPNKAKSKK